MTRGPQPRTSDETLEEEVRMAMEAGKSRTWLLLDLQGRGMGVNSYRLKKIWEQVEARR